MTIKNLCPTFTSLFSSTKNLLVTEDKNSTTVSEIKKEEVKVPEVVQEAKILEDIHNIIEPSKEHLITAHHEPALICPPSPVISFKNVTKSFNGKVAIDDINFEIPQEKEGTIISIVGPSGCGKSTILRIIAGLEPQYPQTSGEVLVFNNKILGTSVERGMVDQKYSLLPNLTVLNNIAFGLKLNGIGRKKRLAKAREWVKKVGLEGSEDKYPQELSGGMQQRVSLASTLILEPKILLMDEPFGALDPKTRLKMQELLISLWKENKGVIIVVTHSMEEAVYLGDKIFRMESNPGRLVEILDAPRPYISPEEMRKMPWFNEMVQELLDRIENSMGAKGEFSVLKKIRQEPEKDRTHDGLQLLKLVS